MIILSHIEQLFKNYEKLLNQDQFTYLRYRIAEQPVAKMTGNAKEMYVIQLSDNLYFTSAYFYEGAARSITALMQSNILVNIEMEVTQRILLLKRWRVLKIKNQNRLVVVISEFDCIGEQPCYEKTQEFIPLEPIEPQEQSAKVKIQFFKKQDKQPEDDRALQKKIKIEYSSFHDVSFLQQYNLSHNSITQPITQVTMIKELYQGMKDWTLEGRVISKSAVLEFIRKHDGSRCEYFKIHILDADKEVIYGTFYGNSYSKFYDSIQQGQVYLFKNAQIKVSKIDGFKSINFEEYSVIRESQTQLPLHPTIIPLFIRDILFKEPNTEVDLHCIIFEEIPSNNHRTFKVFDQTGQIDIKIWPGLECDLKKGDIVCIKGLRVGIYHNKHSLNSNTNSTLIFRHMTSPEQIKLEQFSQSKKHLDDFIRDSQDPQHFTIVKLQEYMEQLIEQRNTKNISDRMLYCYITEIGRNRTTYPGCTNARCLKKMNFDRQRQSYRCPSCDIEAQIPHHRYILNVKLIDETGFIWATAFDEIGTQILNMTAREFEQLQREQQHQLLMKADHRAIRISIDFKEFEGTLKPTFTIVQMKNINYQQLAWQSLEYLEEIQNLNAIAELI